jgi:hypothetical protein
MPRATAGRTGFPWQRLLPTFMSRIDTIPSRRYIDPNFPLQAYKLWRLVQCGCEITASYHTLPAGNCHQPPSHRPQTVLLGSVMRFSDFTMDKARRSRLLCALCMKCIKLTHTEKVACSCSIFEAAGLISVKFSIGDVR